MRSRRLTAWDGEGAGQALPEVGAHAFVQRAAILQPDQAGTYTCMAENAQAEAHKDFVVAVLGTSAP